MNRRTFLLMATACCCGCAGQVPQIGDKRGTRLAGASEPAKDTGRFRKVAQFIETEMAAGTFPGAALIVAQGGRTVFEHYWGACCGIEERGIALDGGVTHMLYSFSKGISATAVVLAHQRGLIDYDAPVQAYIPEYRGRWKEATTIRHLLTHSAGIPNRPSGAAYTDAQWRKCVQECCDAKVEWEPGSRTPYHWASGMLLAAEAVRRKMKMASWEDICREFLLDPIGAHSLRLGIPRGQPIAVSPWPKELPGRIDPAHSSGLGHPGAGFFGQLPDMIKVLQLHLNGGVWNGKVIIQPDELAEMHRIQYETQIASAEAAGRQPNHEPYGLGWLIKRNRNNHWFGLGGLTSPQTFGHAGIDTVMTVADPQRQLALVFITTDSPHPSAGNTTRIRNTITDLVVDACATASRNPRTQTNNYPFTKSFTSDIVPFTLAEEVLPPRSVASSNNARDAAIGPGGATATLLPADLPANAVLDFGREIVGDVNVEVDLAAPATVTFRYGENHEEAMRTLPSPASWYHLPMDQFTLAAGRHTLRNRGRRGFRFFNIVATGAGARVSVRDVRATHRHYPVAARGSFHCSDPLLDRIWEISQNTVQHCMQQYYEDGVKRDGLLWITDFRVTYLCNLLAFGDAALARKSLFIIAASQRDDGALPACASRGGGHQHPTNIEYMFSEPPLNDWMLRDYATDFASCLWDYYWHTADLATVKALWPTTVRLLDYLAANCAIDCLEASRDYLTDNQASSRDWSGSRAALTAQLLCGAKAIGRLAALVRDGAAAGRCGSFQAVLAAGMPRYYSPEQRVYADEPGPARSVSWQANAAAVLAGVVEPAAATALFGRLANIPTARRPQAGFQNLWVTLAKFMAQMPAEAMADIREYWGYMVNHDSTTCWEGLDPRRGIDLAHGVPISLCHGWSAGPCYLFPSRVLGIQASQPAFKEVHIQPALADLAWAQGAFPTPQGEITVRWETRPSMRGRVVLPAGVSGEAVFEASGQRKTVPLTPGANEIAPDPY